MATTEVTRQTAERTRDNPAHAVLKHLAATHADVVKTAIREVTLERLENNGAVAGIASLRAELFGGAASSSSASSNGGGAAGGVTSNSPGGEQGAGPRVKPGRKPRQMTLGEAANSDKDEEIDEEEVEDDEEDEDEEDEETPAPEDEPGERTPLRRPIARGGKGKGDRKGKR